MSAQNSAPIHLTGQPYVFTVEDKQILSTVVDQLNTVTNRLAELESQIANGTLIINETPNGIAQNETIASRAGRNRPQAGWQPTL